MTELTYQANKLISGTLNGLIFGPAAVIVTTVLFDLPLNLLTVLVAFSGFLLGFLLGFYFGYRKPEGILEQFLSVSAVIIFIKLLDKFL